jgi:DNA-binding MarR family transcriptional regulator
MEMPNLCSLRDIYRKIRDFEIRFQQDYGLCLNEGMLLCSIKENKYSSSEIAEMLGLTNSNASKVIKSTENKGYIKRLMGENDKRQMYFAITSAGLKKLNEIKCEGEAITTLLNSITNTDH